MLADTQGKHRNLSKGERERVAGAESRSSPVHGISNACSGASGLSLQLGIPVVYSGGMARIVACRRKDLEPGDLGKQWQGPREDATAAPSGWC